MVDLPRFPASLTASVLLGCALLFPHPVQSQSRTRFLRWIYEDPLSLVQQTDRRTPLYLLGGATALASLSLLDDVIRDELRGGYGGILDEYVDVANEFGNPVVAGVTAGIFATSLVTNDTRFQDAAFTSFQSVIYSGLIYFSTNAVIGRDRPFLEEGAYHFRPFTSNSSLPSGHTTTAFALLTPWALYYPHVVTYSLLAVGAGGTALARISKDKHWATDVLAGGTLGFLIAYWLTKHHQDKAASVTVTPTVGVSMLGVRLYVWL